MKEFRLHGPPGTGKSTYLANVYVPEAAKKFGSDKVVICSLTKTAAAEISSRSMPIPKENVGTLHALAYRSLGKPDIAELHIKDGWNVSHAHLILGGVRASVEDPHGDSMAGRGSVDSTADRLSSRAQILRHMLIEQKKWPDDVLYFQREWEKWKTENGYLDFTGMIEQALETRPICPGNPRVFIVDEAQDCSRLELALVREWAKHSEYVVLAGDGDQAIYAWRGADARAFLAPKIPKENNRHLRKSYRVPVAVHAVATKWIEGAEYRYAVEYQPRDGNDGEAIRASNLMLRSPGIVATAVRKELDADVKRVMILATCAYMLRPIIKAMRDQGILFHNPYRVNNGSWNPLRGGAERTIAFLRPITLELLPKGAKPRLWTWLELHQWTGLLLARGTTETGAKRKIGEYAKDAEMSEKRIGKNDWLDLFTEDARLDLKACIANGTPHEWLFSRIRSSKRSQFEYARTIVEKHGPAMLAKMPRVIIGTIHSVKGGEAESVFLFPDLSRNGMMEYMTAGDSRDGVIRLMYVGMTRASNKLFLCGRNGMASVVWPKPKQQTEKT